MHNGDKVGASAVCKFIRTKMRVAVNPLPEGKDLISKAHKLATHFSYGYERYIQLWKLANALYMSHGEWVNIYLYINGTWMYARQSLL